MSTDDEFPPDHHVDETDEESGGRPPNFLRAWREHRGLTQGQLAEMVGTTGSVISLLESGARGLGDKWLRKLAAALGTRTGHLLEMSPEHADNDILEIWADVPAEDRAKAKRILSAFRSSRPEDPIVRDGTGDGPSLHYVKKPRGRGGAKRP
jgi:transcriptional regulator with XRE-family HTH domain